MSFHIDLRQQYKQLQTFTFTIGDDMFGTVDNSLVKGGKLTALVAVVADSAGLDLQFTINGKVMVECDRCLDDMQIEIDCVDNIKIQFAETYEDTDNVIYVPQNQTEIDLWPLIYDFTVLAIPLVHVHEDGQCNPEMLERLNKYMVKEIGEEELSQSPNQGNNNK